MNIVCNARVWRSKKCWFNSREILKGRGITSAFEMYIEMNCYTK